jgi:Fe2+ transport system protein FeoA
MKANVQTGFPAPPPVVVVRVAPFTKPVQCRVQQIAVILQERVKSGKVIVYTGTIAKATTCGREQ